MAESASTSEATPSLTEIEENDKATWNWRDSAGDLKRSVSESTDSAIRSAKSLHENSSTHIQTLQDLIPKVKSQYQTYEEAFFKKVKDEVRSAKEHPNIAGGIALASALLLMKGSRRFLFRQTLGRFQSEEARYTKADRNVRELTMTVETLKNDTKKLLERAGLAKQEMNRGYNQVREAGSQIESLAKSVSKLETQANDLIGILRDLPGRSALDLRSKVATVAKDAKNQREALEKLYGKIVDLGVSV
ncbi:hypothetical protein ACHQM5_018632 [Ranunculus cassubicifolius]